MAEAKPRESVVKIFLSETELQAVRVAAAVVGARSMSQYCRDLVTAEAQRVTDALDVKGAIKASRSEKRMIQADRKLQRERGRSE